jgi:PDZ domain-containing protein
MRDRRRSAFVVATAVFVGLAVLAFVPTPYYLLSPGSAVDLSTRVTVEGHAPAKRSYYLTDVTVQRATALLLLAGLLPGTRLVKHDFLLPPGETLRGYERVLTAAMDDSQHVAAYVAERAAGLRVAPPLRSVVVADLLDSSRARGVLRIGDRLVRAQGLPIAAQSDAARAVGALHPGDLARVDIERGGRIIHVSVPTIELNGATRLGIEIGVQSTVPELAVPVRFSLRGVEGSSGGLMFALAIYAELTSERRASSPVAGTGTLAPDGTVGAIEGTQQKVIAAERAGARTFLVPRKNYAEIANERGIKVIPVDTFAAALAAVRGI